MNLADSFVIRALLFHTSLMVFAFRSRNDLYRVASQGFPFPLSFPLPSPFFPAPFLSLPFPSPLKPWVSEDAATYAAGERSFWLRFRMARSRMDDERLSNLCLSRLSIIRVISVSKRKLRGVLGRRLPAFPRPPSIFLRSRLPAFLPNDREPGTGYSSLAVLNGHKQRTETNGASTDSLCIAEDAQEFPSRIENRKRNFCNLKK